MLPRKNSDAAERILRTRKWLIGAIAYACFLTGCMVGPNYIIRSKQKCRTPMSLPSCSKRRNQPGIKAISR